MNRWGATEAGVAVQPQQFLVALAPMPMPMTTPMGMSSGSAWMDHVPVPPPGFRVLFLEQVSRLRQ